MSTFLDKWIVVDKCDHDTPWGRYCPQCRDWERRIEEEARRLRAEREFSQVSAGANP